MITAQFERATHDPVHVDTFAYHLANGDRVALMDKIPATQFIRLQPNRFGNAIQMAFERKHALRSTEAAKSTVGWGIRRHRAAADAHVRATIRPRGMDRSARKHHARESFVRAAVEREVDIHCDQLSVAVHGRAMEGA